MVNLLLGLIMRRIDLLMLDVSLMCFATLIAFALRENFEVSFDRASQASPYLLATAVASVIVFGAAGTHRTVWRFANLLHYLRVAEAVVLVIFGAVAMTFAYDRLDGLGSQLAFSAGSCWGRVARECPRAPSGEP